jgi:hypothetical protein
MPPSSKTRLRLLDLAFYVLITLFVGIVLHGARYAGAGAAA